MRGSILEFMRPVTVKLASGEVLRGWSWSPGYSNSGSLTVWQQTGEPRVSRWVVDDRGSISPPDPGLLRSAENDGWLRRWVLTYRFVDWWTEGPSFRESPEWLDELTELNRAKVEA